MVPPLIGLSSEKTIWEINMVRAMNNITDEPGWEKRVRVVAQVLLPETR